MSDAFSNLLARSSAARMPSRSIHPAGDELLAHVADLQRSPLTRALFETKTQFVAIVDLDGRVVAVNDYARRPHLDPQDFLGRPLWAMPPLRNDPTAEGTWRTRFAEALTSDDAVRSEERYPTRSGTAVAVRTEVAALRTTVGSPVVGFVVRGANVEQARRTERLLREQETLGRLTFDESPSLMAVLAPNGDIRDVNAAFLKLVGSSQDVVGRSIVELAGIWPGSTAHADRWRDWLETIRGATRPLHDSEIEHGPDGKVVRAFDTTLTPIRDDDTGELKALLYELHERTGSIEAELRVRRSEERLRALAEAVPQMLWIATDEGVEYFSPRWAEYTGRPLEQLLGHGFVDLIHPDDREGAARWPDVDGGAPPVTFRLLRHDGEYRYMEAQARAVRDPDTGEAVRWFGGTLDVTEQRRADAAAGALQEQLGVALEVTGLGRYELNFAEGTLVADERVAEMVGINDPALLMAEGGMEALFATVDVEHRDRVRAAVEAAMVPGGPDCDVVYPILRDSEEGPERRWLAALGRVEFDGETPVRMVGVIDDMTEKRQEDEARIRLQKLEAMGTLAGGIAHDFNNVIGAILSYARVAEAELNVGESPAESIGEIARGAIRAGELTKRLLTFAREEPVQKVALDLGDVVREAAALARPTLPRGTELHVTVGAGLPEVLGDTTQLHQVVLNLITNAGQALAAQPSGRIDVSVEQVVLGERRTGIVAPLAAGDYLRLRVVDDGPGIPEAILGRVFDPFFTTKGPNEGTGLGLAAVHSIIRNHGGVVAAEPHPGGGAMLTAFLPVQATSGAPAVLPDRAPAAVGEQPVARVLFVDDEEALVRLAYRAMPYCGCEVTGFTDSSEAVAAFAATPEAFDAIVTDFSMPGLTGLELTERVRAIRPDVPVVLTSGYMAQGDHADAQRRGVSTIMPKPCSIDDLASEVLRLLAV